MADKVKKLGDSEAKDVLEKYLREQNRPYNDSNGGRSERARDTTNRWLITLVLPVRRDICRRRQRRNDIRELARRCGQDAGHIDSRDTSVAQARTCSRHELVILARKTKLTRSHRSQSCSRRSSPRVPLYRKSLARCVRDRARLLLRAQKSGAVRLLADVCAWARKQATVYWINQVRL